MSGTPRNEVLTVILHRRLPDVDQQADVPADLERYGRFAILRSDAFWFGDVHSSHPPSTENGFYWALSGDSLYVSPRGSTYRWTEHITAETIRELTQRLGVRRRYRFFRVEQ